MGNWIVVELECDSESLLRFASRWTSKPMAYALAHEHELFDGSPSILDLFAARVDIDVTPLQKLAWGQTDLFFEGIDPSDRTAWAHAEQERLRCSSKNEAS